MWLSSACRSPVGCYLQTVEEEALIKNNNTCKDFLIEAMKYHLLPLDQRLLIKNPRTKPRTPVSLPKVSPRPVPAVVEAASWEGTWPSTAPTLSSCMAALHLGCMYQCRTQSLPIPFDCCSSSSGVFLSLEFSGNLQCHQGG